MVLRAFSCGTDFANNKVQGDLGSGCIWDGEGLLARRDTSSPRFPHDNSLAIFVPSLDKGK